ncbi:MAG: peptidyl-prolyl cis-trans isomerase, EpsD family [Pseudomonadota bacterium]|jgi:EpsD family peptidyl-prolyl cis-trans isomerase
MNRTDFNTSYRHIMSNRPQVRAFSRATRLMAVLPIAVAALALTGCGDDKKEEGKATQAAVRVNKTEVTVHQINQILERQPNLKPEQADAASRQILEGLIDQQLAVEKAEEQKLDRDPQVVQLLDTMRRNVLARAYLERSAAAGASNPTPEDLRKYFDSKPALFSNRRVYALQEFTVPATPEQYKPVMEKLRATKGVNDFIETLKASGIKFNATQTTQAAENLPLGLIDQLAKVSDGEALYITAKDGFKAVLVVASKSQPVTFEQAKPAIEQFLTADRRREFTQAEMKKLRAAAKIEYIGKFAEKPASAAAAAATASGTEAASVAAPAVASEAASANLDASALSKGLSGLK